MDQKKIRIQCRDCKKFRLVAYRRLKKEKHEQNFPRCKVCWQENCKKTSNQRFLKYINKQGAGGCWLWMGAKKGGGYGSFTPYGGKCTSAHQISFRIYNGEIPRGMCVLHSCDNPPCVNPRHLWLGTNLENVQDRERKGRGGNHRGEANGRSKLSWREVKKIRKMCAKKNVTHEAIGHLFGVTKHNISVIARNKTWKQNITT